MLLVERQEKTEWWGAGVVICLERGADLRMAQLMPLPLTVSCFTKIQTGLPFWYLLTRVVPEKGPLNVCVCVYVCVRACVCVFGAGDPLSPHKKLTNPHAKRLANRVL